MRPMRRRDRAKDLPWSLELIDRCTHGVMALTTGEEIPYCLPLSFVRVDDCLYFHGAGEGRKADLLRACPRVCVTFVGQDQPTFKAESHNYTTCFASVIVTGTAHEVLTDEEKTAALEALCRKTLPAYMQEDIFRRAVEGSLAHTAVWRIQMEEISGKSNC